MSKYSTEFKLQVVKYYEENHCGYDTTAKYFNVGYACVQRWVNKYKVHGVKGLIRNQQQYDGNFKKNVVEYIKHQENIKITVAYCDENSEKEIDGVAHFDLTEYVLTDSEKNNSLNEISNMKLSIGEGGIGGGPCVPITTISYKRNNSSYFVKYWGNILQESNDGNIYKIIDKTSDAPQSQEYCFYYIESLGSTINNITKYER